MLVLDPSGGAYANNKTPMSSRVVSVFKLLAIILTWLIIILPFSVWVLTIYIAKFTIRLLKLDSRAGGSALKVVD